MLISVQDDTQVTTLQRPTTNDLKAWKTYWEVQGQLWRTEPEIDGERQQYLQERRTIKPDSKQGIYPFKGIKLNRADVEWLLATHERGRGPVDWTDESQRSRVGLDIRGADLQRADLHDLPLACTCAGLRWIMGTREWLNTTTEKQNMARVNLQRANLKGAHLEGANITKAFLEDAYLVGAHLEQAYLSGTHLEHAYLIDTHLEDANLTWTHFEKADLARAHLERAKCRGTFFDANTTLENISLGEKKSGFTTLVDIRWGGVDLSVVNWISVNILGNEQEARQKQTPKGIKKDKETRLKEYETAVRANRQLAAVLRDQGLNEEADHFAYRAQKLQRIVLRRQRKFGRYLFSNFLDLLAGYGYRPGRSVFWYLVIVCSFALAYHILGQLSVYPPDAFIYSLTSFHGRGFFPGLEHRTSLHDPLIMLAAIEAVVGLFIEISFIATFTQRFFGK